MVPNRESGISEPRGLAKFLRQGAVKRLREFILSRSRYVFREVGHVSLQHFVAQLLEPGRIVGSRRSVASH
jgi:hypothetical protein